MTRRARAPADRRDCAAATYPSSAGKHGQNRSRRPPRHPPDTVAAMGKAVGSIARRCRSGFGYEQGSAMVRSSRRDGHALSTAGAKLCRYVPQNRFAIFRNAGQSRQKVCRFQHKLIPCTAWGDGRKVRMPVESRQTGAVTSTTLSPRVTVTPGRCDGQASGSPPARREQTQDPAGLTGRSDRWPGRPAFRTATLRGLGSPISDRPTAWVSGQPQYSF